jgi:DNA-directed RNA polymerase subunit RPC12/RpoP
MSNDAEYALSRGIVAAKSKEFVEARNYLERVINLDPDINQKVEAWYWLSEVSSDPDEQRHYIEMVLATSPSDGRARRKLAILDGKLKPSDVIDPDQIVKPLAVEPSPANVKRFTCPQCGGRMVYSTNGQTLICEYCESRQFLAKNSVNGSSFDLSNNFTVEMATAKGHLKPVSRRTFKCQGCGAEFILPPEQMTLTCPFCASNFVIQNDKPKELYDPNVIIPFKIDETQAKVLFKTWLDVKTDNTPAREFHGVGIYLPVWSFDFSGEIPWQCMIKQDKKWVPLNGLALAYERNLLIPATKKCPRHWAKFLRNYILDESVPFQEEYLASMPAETYQISMSDASLEARNMIYSQKRRQIETDINHEYTNLSSTSTSIVIDLFSLLLLPVWIITFSHEDKRHEALINGQTGVIKGDKPRHGIMKWLDNLTGQ